jgi:hypothetical protein
MARASQGDRFHLNLDAPGFAGRRAFLAAIGGFWTTRLSAQDDAAANRRSSPRLETMRRLAKGVELTEVAAGKPGHLCPLRREPLLHYWDPERDIAEGTLWGWGEHGRPRAVLKLEFLRLTRRRSEWAFGVSALGSNRVEVNFGDGATWSSRQPGLQPRSLPEAPAAADSATQRLTQAKALARRFSLSVETGTASGRIQLRLLPRPIDRYNDPEAGILDGVLFTFVYATNPIALLGLEVSPDTTGVRAWRYGLVRQGTGQATAHLDGRAVWTVPALDVPVNSDLYMARTMTDGAAAQ